MPASRQRSLEPMGDHRSCPNSPIFNRSFRLVLLGSVNTGKSAIIHRFLHDSFRECYLPTIEDFHRKVYKIRGDVFQLDILDTGGNNSFPAARRLSLLTGDLFSIVSSSDNRESFEEALRLREEIMDLKQDRLDMGQVQVPMVIVLNKIDLPLNEDGIEIAEAAERIDKSNNCAFVPCSAKTGKGVDDIFAELFQLAKLPKQMSPHARRKMTGEMSFDAPFATSSDSEINHGDSRLSRKRRTLHRLRSKYKDRNQTLCYEDEGARRPSLRTDLLVLRAKSSAPPGLNQYKNSKKCLIQ